MEFLKEYGFEKEDISELVDNTPKKLLKLLEDHEELVEANLKYLKGLKILTYKEILISYPDMFLMDHSNFKDMFEKYETDELVEKLNSNYKVVEYL